MRHNKGFFEQLRRIRRHRLLRRIRSKLHANRQQIENQRRDIDRLEGKLKSLEMDLEDEERRYREMADLYAGEQQQSKKLGATLEIRDKQIELLTELVERERLRVESECSVFLRVTEGGIAPVNPTREVRQAMQEMNGL